MSRIESQFNTEGVHIMGFLNNLRNALARFMYGRNGMDHLNRALMVCYLVLWVLQYIFAALKLGILVTVCTVPFYAVLITVLFRMFSKNLYKRRAENQKWVNWWYPTKSRLAGAKARHADKDHKYFTCKKCKTICRVPAGKGKIIITCPKCGGKIEGKS